jgi:hypothetical protein
VPCVVLLFLARDLGMGDVCFCYLAAEFEERVSGYGMLWQLLGGLE